MTLSLAKKWIAWALLALSIWLLRYQVHLQSDALFYDALARDLLLDGGAWSDWKFSGAPGFVPDMLLYLVGFLILPDPASRLLFVSAVQALLFALLGCLLLKRLFPRLPQDGQSLVVLACAGVTLASAQSGMWLYFHTTNNHFGTVLMAMAALLLAARLLRKPDWRVLALLAITVALATASSHLFILNFSLPVLALLALALWRCRGARRLRRRLLQLGAAIVAGHALGWCLEALLIHHVPIEGRPPWSRAAVEHSADLLLTSTWQAFGLDNLATLLVALCVTAALLLVLYRSLQCSYPGRAAHAGALLLWLALPINIGGTVLSASMVDLAGYRYFAFPLTLAVVLAIGYLSQSQAWRRGLQLLWGALALLICANALYVAQISSASVPLEPTRAVAACIAAAETEGFSARAGIADYWNARAVSYQRAGHLPILATLHDATPMFWVSSLGPLKTPERYRESYYNFAILRNPGFEGQFHYTPEKLGPVLPAPSQIVACDDGVTQLWLYRGPDLNTAVHASITAFLQQMKRAP